MRHVMQRRATDCFAACVASLIGADIEHVPNFYPRAKGGDAMHRQMQKWLARNHGLTLVTLTRSKEDKTFAAQLVDAAVPARFIATVPVVGGWHCVVAGLYGSRLRLIHDPGNQARIPLSKAETVSFLVPLRVTQTQAA